MTCSKDCTIIKNEENCSNSVTDFAKSYNNLVDNVYKIVKEMAMIHGEYLPIDCRFKVLKEKVHMDWYMFTEWFKSSSEAYIYLMLVFDDPSKFGYEAVELTHIKTQDEAKFDLNVLEALNKALTRKKQKFGARFSELLDQS